jgi:hypothetical protein
VDKVQQKPPAGLMLEERLDYIRENTNTNKKMIELIEPNKNNKVTIQPLVVLL